MSYKSKIRDNSSFWSHGLGLSNLYKTLGPYLAYKQKA
jgi:hypothetical protein